MVQWEYGFIGTFLSLATAGPMIQWLLAADFSGSGDSRVYKEYIFVQEVTENFYKVINTLLGTSFIKKSIFLVPASQKASQGT